MQANLATAQCQYIKCFEGVEFKLLDLQTRTRRMTSALKFKPPLLLSCYRIHYGPEEATVM